MNRILTSLRATPGKNALIVVLAALALFGCSTAVAGEDTPATYIECSGYSGGCGTVFWVERDGTKCAIPMGRDGSLAGIDCGWADETGEVPEAPQQPETASP